MAKPTLSTKERGALGENIACEYLVRHGFSIIARNVARKTGEIDIIAEKEGVFHFVEVKSVLCETFPDRDNAGGYNPAFNLHANKIRKVVRTAEWYLKDMRWEGAWQVDGVLVWLCTPHRLARVEYLPQIQ